MGVFAMGSIRARNDNGLLFLDFRVGNNRVREQTRLKDTPANRKLVGRVLARIEETIAMGIRDGARRKTDHSDCSSQGRQ